MEDYQNHEQAQERNGHRRELSREEIAELRQAVWPKRKASRFAIDPRIMREFGPLEGLFLCVLVPVADKGHDRAHWIYKTTDEISERTGLTRNHIERIRRDLLEARVIEAEKRQRRREDGSVAHPSLVWHYRINWRVFFARLGIEHPSLNHKSILLQRGSSDCCRAAVQTAAEGQFNTQSTAIENNKGSLFKRAAEPAFAEPAAPTSKEKEKDSQRRRDTLAGKCSATDVARLIHDATTEAGQLAREYLSEVALREQDIWAPNEREIAEVVSHTFHNTHVCAEDYLDDVERALESLAVNMERSA